MVKELKVTVMKSTDSKRIGVKEIFVINSKGGGPSGPKLPKVKQKPIREILAEILLVLREHGDDIKEIKEIIEYNVKIGILKMPK